MTEPREGIEYNLRKGSELAWNSIHFNNVGDGEKLSGYSVGIRWFVTRTDPTDIDTFDPNTDVDEPTTRREYPGFVLVSMELTVDDINRFTTKTGDELFDGREKLYGVNEEALSGIIDGTRYSYAGVFDKADIGFYPRLATNDATPVYGKPIPSDPYEPDSNPPKYPIDGLTSFLPDDRSSVTVNYKLEVTIKPVGNNRTITETVNITHEVTQSDPATTDWSDEMKAYQDRSYFGNGLIHSGLYPPNHPKVYNDDGEIVGDINEPTTMEQLTRSSYPVDGETLNPIDIVDDCK